MYYYGLSLSLSLTLFPPLSLSLIQIRLGKESTNVTSLLFDHRRSRYSTRDTFEPSQAATTTTTTATAAESCSSWRSLMRVPQCGAAMGFVVWILSLGGEREEKLTVSEGGGADWSGGAVSSAAAGSRLGVGFRFSGAVFSQVRYIPRAAASWRRPRVRILPTARQAAATDSVGAAGGGWRRQNPLYILSGFSTCLRSHICSQNPSSSSSSSSSSSFIRLLEPLFPTSNPQKPKDHSCRRLLAR